MRVTGVLMLLFGSHETSDAWVDALKMWWLQVRSGLGHVKRLVIYLDNGPKNSGRRTQFLKRMVQFSDWSGLEIRLVYYPPYPYAQLKGNWGLVHARVTLAAPQDASVTPCELGGSARKSPRPACQGCHQRPSPFEPCRNWSSMKNGKPLFHHVLQCVSCWKK